MPLWVAVVAGVSAGSIFAVAGILVARRTNRPLPPELWLGTAVIVVMTVLIGAIFGSFVTDSNVADVLLGLVVAVGLWGCTGPADTNVMHAFGFSQRPRPSSLSLLPI